MISNPTLLNAGNGLADDDDDHNVIITAVYQNELFPILPSI